MKENDINGHIVHINSIAGHYVPQLPKPVLNVYPASKFAVTALTETLIHELRCEGTIIKVTVSILLLLLLLVLMIKYLPFTRVLVLVWLILNLRRAIRMMVLKQLWQQRLV